MFTSLLLHIKCIFTTFFFSLNKSIKKLKEEILEAENDGTRQKEDIKQNLTSEFKIKLDKVQKEKNEELRQLKHDLDETLLNLESSRKNHCEEVLLIENANRQSLAIAHQDQRYGNTVCGVFKEGVQNWESF